MGSLFDVEDELTVMRTNCLMHCFKGNLCPLMQIGLPSFFLYNWILWIEFIYDIWIISAFCRDYNLSFVWREIIDVLYGVFFFCSGSGEVSQMSCMSFEFPSSSYSVMKIFCLILELGSEILVLFLSEPLALYDSCWMERKSWTLSSWTAQKQSACFPFLLWFYWIVDLAYSYFIVI